MTEFPNNSLPYTMDQAAAAAEAVQRAADEPHVKAVQQAYEGKNDILLPDLPIGIYVTKTASGDPRIN